jgi:hypothetical protein
MSGVAFRCPTCGTTQTHAGECDACSEAQVRYFCTNHTPGVWLDAPTCGQCGASFGEAPTTRLPATAPARTVSLHKTRTPDVTPSIRADDDHRPTVRRGRRPPAVEPRERSVPPSLRDLLDRLSDGPERDEETFEARPHYESAPKSSILAGCLVRLLLLVLVLIALGIAGLFLLFGGALR